jgi:transcriptional repressor NrdR
VIANAQALAARLEERGAKLVAGGTDTHLALVDVSPLGITGKDADEALERSAITCNKNGIPFDPAAPGQDQRHPRRLARRHDPRLWRGGIPRHGGHDRGRARRAARQRHEGNGAVEADVKRARPHFVRALPDLLGALIALPFCAHEDSQVKDSRPDRGRLRHSPRPAGRDCGARFTRSSGRKLRELTVVNPVAARAFDRSKLDRSLATPAQAARPAERIERLVTSVQRQLETSGDNEVSSAQIGEMVMDGLKALDPCRLHPLRSVYKDSGGEGFRAFCGDGERGGGGPDALCGLHPVFQRRYYTGHTDDSRCVRSISGGLKGYTAGISRLS